MTFLLFLFNDPIYPVHIYAPSFTTYALTELASALFISGILIFWLRELTVFRPTKPQEDWGKVKKLIFTSQGLNKCAIVYQCIFYIILVINFMVLNCVYYFYVDGDPSYGGRFEMDRETEGNGDAFVLPITISICLLLFYYFQYTVAVLIGFKRLIFDFKKKTARKVTFISGVCVHLFFIFCVLFGVFSRHFANGGVQLVAYTVINLYVYVLCIFNWPVVLYCTEFDTDTADD